MNIVVYQSKNGHTAQYAKWVAEALGCAAKPMSDMNKDDWNTEDTVIFGGGIYMGKIQGCKKAFRLRKNKPLVLFACGANQGTDADLAYVKTRNLSPVQQSRLPFYFFPSDMDLANTKGFMKWMMTKIVVMIEKKAVKTDEDRKFLEMMKPSASRMDKSRIEALVRDVQETSR